jgi:uncharacterized protein (TIGR03083 family)
MDALPPILTSHLFEELDGKLIDLLQSLTPSEWQRSTIVPRWNVKQIAAHLVDTPLRRLSIVRDGDRPPQPEMQNDRDLANFVNELNARGVEVYGRLSPPVLISLMRVAVRELRDYFASLDPAAPAAFGVSWAGERISPNWFDIAREFTERWHHQQQIRLAVDRPGISTPHLQRPVLDCFMRGLPYAYRDLHASNGGVAHIRIDGASGGDWFVHRHDDRWHLVATAEPRMIVCKTTIPEDIAWRLFTKGIDRAAARAHITIEGDERLASGVLGLVAIIA